MSGPACGLRVALALVLLGAPALAQPSEDDGNTATDAVSEAPAGPVAATDAEPVPPPPPSPVTVVPTRPMAQAETDVMAPPGATAQDEDPSILESWWFWTAAAVVVVTTVAVIMATSQSETLPHTTLGNMKAFD